MLSEHSWGGHFEEYKMAIAYDTVINRGFYLANILSAQSQELPSASQQAEGLGIINTIYDSLSALPSFSSLQMWDTYEGITTKELWIATENVANVPSDVTFVIGEPWMSVTSANCFLTTGVNQPTYPLIIYQFGNWTRRYWVRSQAITKYVYFSQFITDTLTPTKKTTVNRFLFDPVPSENGLTFNFFGVRIKPDALATTDFSPPTLELYLQYKLAFELAMIYGKETEWVNTPKAKRLFDLEDLIQGKNAINLTLNPIQDAYSKRYSGFINSTTGNP